MTLSATFTVGGLPVTDAMEVAYGGAVALALTSTSDVHVAVWTVEGRSDYSVANPVITPAGTPPGATASYTQSADQGEGKGLSFLIQCRVWDVAGNYATAQAVIGTPNEAGIIPGAAGEKLARQSVIGWTEVFNSALADNIAMAKTVNTVSNANTLIYSHALAAATITTVGVRIWTTETAGGTNALLREWTAAFIRKGAGAAAQVGADSDGGLPILRDDGAWVAEAVLNANALEIRVTNDAANPCRSRAQFWVYECPII
jgi:hypothetical protein